MSRFYIGWRDGRASAFGCADTVTLDEFMAFTEADRYLDEITLIEANGHSLYSLSESRREVDDVGGVQWSRPQLSLLNHRAFPGSTTVPQPSGSSAEAEGSPLLPSATTPGADE